MPNIRVPVTDDIAQQLAALKVKLGKNKRVIVREALEEYFIAQRYKKRGFVCEWVRISDPQAKLDLD